MQDDDVPAKPWSLSEDDLRLAKESGFDISAFTPESAYSREGYRRVKPEDSSVDLSDYGRSVVSGAAGLGAGAGALTSWATNGYLGEDTRKYFNDIAQDQTERMGPRARRAVSSEVFPDEGKQSIFDDFLPSLGLKTVAALPSTVASIIPGGIAARVLSGAGTATRVAAAGATARGTNAVMNGGDVANQIYSEIDKMSDDELKRQSPLYAGYRSAMSEKDARSRYMPEVAGAAPVLGLIVGAATPGVEHMIAGRLAGQTATGLVKGVAKGAAVEGPQELIENSTGEFASQQALIAAGLKSQMDWEKVLSQGIEGLLVGTAMGSTAGGVSNIGGGAKPAAQPKNGVSINQKDVDPDHAAALNSKQSETAVTEQSNEGDAAKPELNNTVPEDPETLKLQQEKLVAGEVPAMLFTPGTEELAVPEGFERYDPKDIEDPELREKAEKVGIFHYDPSLLPTKAIDQAIRNDRVNELLGYNQSKEEVVAKQQQGVPSAAVVERTPDGTEVRGAISSADQVREQANRFQQQATPGNSVGVEDVDSVVQARQAASPVPNEVGDALERRRQAEREEDDRLYKQLGDERDRKAAAEQADYDDAWYDYQAEKRLAAERDAQAPQQPSSISTDPFAAQNEQIRQGYKDFYEGTPIEPEPPTQPSKAMSARAVAEQRAAQKAEKARAKEVAKAEKALAVAKEREAKAAQKKQEQAAKAEAKAAKAKEAAKKREAKKREVEKPEPPKPSVTQSNQQIAPDLFTAEVKTASGTEVAAEQPKKLSKFWVKRATEQTTTDTVNPETGKHWTKAELAQRERVASAAKSAFDAHPPGADELYNGPDQGGLNFSGRKKEAPSQFIQTPKQALALRKRLAAMVAMVEKAGKIPQSIHGTASDHLAFVRQAKDALEHYAGKDSKEARAKMNDFVADELAARQGDFEPLRKRRLQEGDEAKRQNQGDVEAVTADTTKDSGRRLVEATSTADPETIMEQANEASRRELAMQEIERQLNEHGEINDIGALEKIMGKKSADMATIQKILSGSLDIAEREMSPYEARLRQRIAEIMESQEKLARANDRSTIENRQVKEAERIDNDQTRASARLGKYRQDVAIHGDESRTGKNGGTVIKNRLGEAEAIDTKSVSDMLREGGSYYIDAGGELPRAIANMISRLAGNTDVHFLSDEDFQKLYPNSGGVFTGKFIVLPENTLASAERMRHVVLHEAVHAALTSKVIGDPLAISQIKAISAEVLSQNPDIGSRYAFENVHEFLAEALSNERFQRLLAQTELSPGLAEQLGLNNQDWRGKSQWWGLVNKFAEWLGFGRDPNIMDALNAILSVTDRLAEGRAPEYQNSSWQNYFPPQYGLTADRTALSAERRAGQRTTLPGHLYLSTEELLDGGKDRASAFKNFMRRAAVKGATLDQLRQMAKGLFTDAKGDALERVVAGIQRMAPYAQSKREAAEKLAQRFINYRNANPGGADKLSSLAIDATMANVKLGPNADNKHLVKGWRGWQGSEQLASLQNRFNTELDAEGKQLYQDMATFYSAQQNEITKGLIDNILKEADINPKDRTAFIQRVMTGTMTNADDTLLKDKPTVLKGLKDATELRSIQGDYFPLMRNGNYVVTTKNNIEDTGAGKEVEPGKVEFRAKSRQEAMKLAEAWAKKSSLPVLSVQQSKDTSTSTDFGVVVNVQRDGAHFFESEAEAFKWRRENQGQFDQISQVQDRRTTALQSADLTTTQFNMLKGSIERQANASDEVKQMMHDVVQQAAARMMSGNRVQQRSIARRNVAGASKDFGRTLIQYGQATGGYLAKIKYMPEVREALNSMSELAYDDMSAQAPARVRVLNEVKARIDQNVVAPNEGPVWLKDLMGLTFLGKLFSPMYSVINGMQPWMVTMPVLAGRYGAMRANAALGSAYNSLGFTDAMVAGFRNSYLAGKQWSSAGLLDTTDLIGSIKKKLSTQADGAQLSKLIDMLQERGAMSSGGFEMAQALSEGRGAFGTTLSRVDRIARQLPQAVEDINRASSAIAAYRLARAAGMNEEKASGYAFDVVMNTQGDYSAVNAPRFFANPYLRPALQFKKYAQMMAYLLADMAHKSFAGATPQERAQARKALANVFAVQVAMAGALSLPGLEIVKLGFMIAAVFGAGQGWDDQEERLRKLAEDSLGKKWGELVSKGVISRAIGIDISQRVSLSDMFIFGEPKKYDKENLQGYFAQTLLGAPGSTAFDFIQGWQEIQNGEPWEKGASKMIPVKFVADALKAKYNYDEGKATLGEAALNTFGARSGRQAEAGRGIGESTRKREELQDRYKRLQQEYLRAKNAGQLAVARAKIVDHNKEAPLRYKLFPNALDKVRTKIKEERVN